VQLLVTSYHKYGSTASYFHIPLLYFVDYYGHATDQAGSISNTYDMRLGGAQFESWPVHQLFGPITYVIFIFF
jgi:hypothetical protein